MTLLRGEPQAGRVVVSFRLPPEVTASHVAVVGDFNDWSPDATVMLPDPDCPGGLRADVELSPGRRYCFRYVIDGVQWANDWAADDYVANAQGGEDSVVDLTVSTASHAPLPPPFGA